MLKNATNWTVKRMNQQKNYKKYKNYFYSTANGTKSMLKNNKNSSTNLTFATD